jgi:prevent-host-death family protein
MATVGMHQAKTQLSQLVERAVGGEDITISRNGAPVVRLVPVATPNRMADIRGSWQGRAWIADDFDALPDEVAEQWGLDG